MESKTIIVLRITTCSLILLVSSIQLSAQIKIVGKVIDDKNTPIGFANVFLSDTINEKIISGTTTDQEGRFTIGTDKKGAFTLQISFIGFKGYQKKISVSKDLGKIILTQNVQALESFTVTAKQPLIEKKIDRMVFNVEQIVSLSGGNALDALKVTPRVKVRGGEVSMVGKSNMRVLIGDRLIQLSGEELANFLATIPADDIKSIEVITTPPAKYTAEGNSGLINIVTKKTRKKGWSSSIRGVYKQATYPTGTAGMGFNLQRKKITLNTDVDYTNGSIAPFLSNTIYYANGTWKEETGGIQFSNSLATRINGTYKISEKIKTGFLYQYTGSQPEIKDDITTFIYKANTQELDSNIFTKAIFLQEKSLHNLNYHLIYDIDTLGRMLSFDFDYFGYKSDSKRDFETKNNNNNLSISANNIGKQDINTFSFNLDMKHPIPWFILNYGGKISYINTKNDFEFYNIENNVPIFDPTQSNQFQYKENTQAGYVSVQKELSDRWEVQIGLRLENTELEGNSITLNLINKNSYAKLFPTAYIFYTPNDDHSFSLNYGRRISRPDFGYLNPFRWVNSPYSYSEGNPFLQPSFTQNIDFEYVFKKNFITALYYSYLEDGFEYVTIINDTSNIQQVVPRNFVINKTFGVSQTIIYKPAKWWNIDFYADIYYSSTRSKIPVTLNFLESWNAEFSLSNDFTLNKNKTLLFNISYAYITDGVDNLDRNNAFSQLDVALKFLLLEKKLVINLYGNDILRTAITTYTTFSNNIENSFTNYYDDRYFRLSAILKFGGKIKKIKDRNMNENDIDRIN